MATAEERSTVKQIRSIVTKSGYDYRDSYNDKLANGRKIKFMPAYGNAWPTARQQTLVKNRVTKQLAEVNIQVKSVDFEQCIAGHGISYRALVIRL